MLSFRDPSDLNNPLIVWIPETWSVVNFKIAIALTKYWQALLNNLRVSTITTICQLACTSLAGYAFARLKFKGSNILFWLVMLTLIVPPQVTASSRSLFFTNFDILGIVPTVAMICYFISILGILLTAVFAILNIPFVSVSSSPKGFKRNIALSTCGIVFTVISIISFFIFNAQLSAQFGEMYSGNIGIGSFLVIVGFLAIIGINILIKKQNIPVKYTDVSEYVERIARRKAEIAEMKKTAKNA